MRDAAIISGSDRTITAQAYTLIMMPACASVRENVAAISVSRPIGINSDVLNTNAENVMPKSGSHCRREIPLCIIRPPIAPTALIPSRPRSIPAGGL